MCKNRTLISLTAAVSVYINNNLIVRVKLKEVDKAKLERVAIINQYIDAKQNLSRSIIIPK